MFANKLKWEHLVVPNPFETRPFNEKKEIKPVDERKITLSLVNFNMQLSGARSGNKPLLALSGHVMFSTPDLR